MTEEKKTAQEQPQSKLGQSEKYNFHVACRGVVQPLATALARLGLALFGWCGFSPLRLEPELDRFDSAPSIPPNGMKQPPRWSRLHAREFRN